MTFAAKLTTTQNTFWLSSRGHWLTDSDRACQFFSRISALRAAARTRCVRRKWGDKVSLVGKPAA